MDHTESMLDDLRDLGANGQKGAVFGNLPLNIDVKMEDTDLGDDNYDIINRAQKHYENLRSKNQVNLDDEKNLKDLEDSELLDYMAIARLLLAEFNKTQEELPSRTVAESSDIKNRRDLSNALMELKQTKSNVQFISDDMFILNQDMDTKCNGKMFDISSNVSDVINNITSIEKSMTIFRRSYETTVDALLRRCIFFEDSYTKLSASIKID